MKKKLLNLSASMLGIAVVASTLSCSNQKQQESPMKAKVEEYAPVEMKTSIFQ